MSTVEKPIDVEAAPAAGSSPAAVAALACIAGAALRIPLARDAAL